ncbi:MAG: hypothetical protein A3B34_02955 [Candidatus Sungbacteria bacterium RIFCSPLOWO2_01_FULL_54_21]|uniref:Uncharacterized protein n=1 Tax=Candidatus Sungbacteria bacterium RIFCSPLOWO2_01_FULL_54_21 TaxID=1802279 RepID=A0A1G2L9D9_9BACT|nr:MAG: hypothetical protein A2679_03760 [Candidatus Sungbacteria bacterium RIFCSPHIGHO2_01_FULL_54_26]OHA07389.1 MAG: hypothetical protein A3B34_02955 [Candidatus Sungbacteria bacterium RIFCSPLOWO2_01_FULL_54_21]
MATDKMNLMAKKISTIGELAAMIQWTMASKEDLKALKVELKGDIAGVRSELKGDIAQMREEMATKTEMRDGFYAVNRRIDLLRKISPTCLTSARK